MAEAMRELRYDPLWKKLIDAKLTKTEFAEKVGISRTTLAKLGRNEIVSLDVIIRICRELDCDVVDMMSIGRNQAWTATTGAQSA